MYSIYATKKSYSLIIRIILLYSSQAKGIFMRPFHNPLLIVDYLHQSKINRLDVALKGMKRATLPVMCSMQSSKYSSSNSRAQLRC